MSDDVQRLRPWQIKDFPEEKRKAVMRAAAGAGKTVAQWLEPVIDAGLTGSVNLEEAVARRLSAETLALIAGNAAIARWVRSGAARQLGGLMGLSPPTPPRRHFTVAVSSKAIEPPPDKMD